MRAKPRRFRNLRWKLTWSYVWITLIVTLCFNMLLVGAALLAYKTPTETLLRNTNQFHANEFSELWTTAPPEASLVQAILRFKFGWGSSDSAVTPYNASEYINFAVEGAVQSTVVGFAGNSPSIDLHMPATAFDPASQMPEGNTTWIALIDAQGQFLAGSYPASSAGQFNDPQYPQALDLINAALRDAPIEQRSLIQNQAILSAAPIKANGQIVGAMYVRISVGGESASFVIGLLVGLTLATITVTFVVNGLIGLLYGYIAARPFSRRLRRLTSAATLLAEGNFDQRIDDDAADEIGQLAQQFNWMAGELDANMRKLVQLADSNAALAEQSSQLATIEERNRLARDLHDSVSQELFSASMLAAAAQNLLTAQPERAAEHLVQLRQMLQRAHHETRTLIFALRPAALGDQGLSPALRQLRDMAAERQGLTIDLQIRGERRLPLEHEQALFRITQEALANVMRHSGTHQATINLEYTAEQTLLTIKDQGRGFDSSAPRKAHSLGLISISERVKAVDGTWTITAQPGQGTTLRIIVPRKGTTLSTTQR